MPKSPRAFFSAFSHASHIKTEPPCGSSLFGTFQGTHGIPGRGFSCVHLTPDSYPTYPTPHSLIAAPVLTRDAAAGRGLRCCRHTCAIMRRSRWHVQASEAVHGVRRRAEPSYVLTSTRHARRDRSPPLHFHRSALCAPDPPARRRTRRLDCRAAARVRMHGRRTGM